MYVFRQYRRKQLRNLATSIIYEDMMMMKYNFSQVNRREQDSDETDNFLLALTWKAIRDVHKTAVNLSCDR